MKEQSPLKEQLSQLPAPSAPQKTLPDPVPPWLKKLPNRLTLFRILCIPIVVYLLLQCQTLPFETVFWNNTPIVPSFYEIAAGIVFSLAAITDFFDGWIARKFHVETVLGKLLDPLADKLLVVATIIVLVEKHRLAGWLAVIIIVRDLGINAIRISALDDGIQIPSSALGKYKTFFQDLGIGGLCVYGYFFSFPFHLMGQGFIWLSVLAGVASAVQYLSLYARELKKRNIL